MADYKTLCRRQREGGPGLSDREFHELLASRATVASPDPRINEASGIPTARELALRFGKELPAEPAPAAVPSGGAPLEPVMPVEDARRLQAVIDLARSNQHPLNIAQLARRFGVSRGRIRQAIRMREKGLDLFVSPPELQTDTDRIGKVFWATLENPSKS
jgi:hypothetical protein